MFKLVIQYLLEYFTIAVHKSFYNSSANNYVIAEFKQRQAALWQYDAIRSNIDSIRNRR